MIRKKFTTLIATVTLLNVTTPVMVNASELINHATIVSEASTENNSNNILNNEIYEVKNENELREALANENVQLLTFANDINVSSDLLVERSNFIIDGNGYKLILPTSTTNPSNSHFTGDNITIKNLTLSHQGTTKVKSCIITVSGDNFTIENSNLLNGGNYGIQFYKVKNALVKNVRIDGAKNGGLLVNTSEVTVQDTILSNNKLTGIEVIFGSGVNINNNTSVLNVTGALTIYGSPVQIKAETGKGAVIKYDSNQLIENPTLLGMTTYVTAKIGEELGPNGDVTPEITQDPNPADEGFGPNGDVTPNVTPDINLEVTPEQKPAEEGFGPNGSVTPEVIIEDKIDANKNTSLPTTGGTSSSLTLGLGALLTVLGITITKKNIK